MKLASNRFDVDNFTFISHNKTMIIDDDGFISSPPEPARHHGFSNSRHSSSSFFPWNCHHPRPPFACIVNTEHVNFHTDFVISNAKYTGGGSMALFTHWNSKPFWKFVLKLKYLNYYIFIVICDDFHHTANIFIRFRLEASLSRQLKTQLGTIP